MEQLQIFSLSGMNRKQLFIERAKAVERGDEAKARGDVMRWRSYLQRQKEINAILLAKKDN